MRVALLCLVAVAVAVAATPVPYTNCGNGADHVKITSVDATPYPPVKGKAISVNATGTSNEAVSSGNYDIKVVYLGIPILNKQGSICELTTCPIAAGPISVTKTETIPGIAPSGAYSIQLSATDQNNQQLLCVSLNVTISAEDDDEQPPQKPIVLGDEEPIQTEEFVNHINSVAKTWTAGHNPRLDGLSVHNVKTMCGALKSEDNKLPIKYDTSMVHLDLPTSFDSRDKWTNCTSLNTIRDQGACGSCWAVSSAESMSDRLCIATAGQFNSPLASEDVLSCCQDCGMGCGGGYPSAAWSYAQSSGVVTGGAYNSTQWCYPYGVAPCEHHVTGPLKPCGQEGPTPQCTQSCVNGQQWSKSKQFAASAYSVSSDPQSIAKEIMLNGPVVATYDVYSDFPSYKGGVYQHTTGSFLGGHAVKIIGWGVENGTPYWLVANSWNTSWGLKGYFKILRGQNECGIESGIVAGTFNA